MCNCSRPLPDTRVSWSQTGLCALVNFIAVNWHDYERRGDGMIAQTDWLGQGVVFELFYDALIQNRNNSHRLSK